ncbi:MAG: hypothetical protein IH594_09905, partial [Bacteroidales bacterium]|nr:hypothetical protein [Bacteroidales bacterium]
MRKCVLHILIAVLACSLSEPASGQYRKYINLNENWVVSEAKSGIDLEKSIPVDFKNPGKDWFQATMPEQIQDILFNKGIIPDPHFGNNPTRYTWVFEKDWIYVTRFTTPDSKGEVFLCFDGIDTRADVWVNGKKIGECANMFRKYRFQVSSFLKNDGSSNVLSVFVHSPAKFLEGIEQQISDTETEAHKYLRKTGSDFSAYMGARPNFLKMGIYKNVYLDIPGENYLGDVFVRTSLSDNFSKAQISINPDIQGSGTSKISYS